MKVERARLLNPEPADGFHPISKQRNVVSLEMLSLS